MRAPNSPYITPRYLYVDNKLLDFKLYNNCLDIIYSDINYTLYYNLIYY